jgi:signal transduction histidine kinase
MLLGWIGVHAVRRATEENALRTVAVAADARERALTQRLEFEHGRERTFLQVLRRECQRGSRLDLACARAELTSFVATEIADSGLLLPLGAEPIGVGPQAGTLAPPIPAEEEEFATIRRDAAGAPFYVSGVRLGPDAVVIRHSVERFLAPLFRDRYGLGMKGETFLADANGYFVTPSRYPSHSGYSHPVSARPMNACLARGHGETIDYDYRGAMVIHGYRFVEALGGACIMAHVDFAEAMVPAVELQKKLVVAVGGFVLVAIGWSLLFWRMFARPISRLTARVHAYQEGDVSSEVHREGPSEVRLFANAFDSMARTLVQSEQGLKEAVQMRDEFISVAAHELRTPLTALRLVHDSLIRQIRGEPSSGQVTKWLKAVESGERQVIRIQRLIEQMLDVSRMRAGKLPLNVEETDLTEVVSQVLSMLADQIRSSGSSVELQSPSPVCGTWDRFRIEQLVMNLLTNALKYGQGKPVLVEVSLSGRVARLGVRDHGVGIRDEERGRLFEPYERAASARPYGGFGLGLFIVRTIVEAHGGSVGIEFSAPGEGTLVVVRLPLEREKSPS